MTFTFDLEILSFDLWPWTFAVYRLWRDETRCHIWTQSSNPRRSYCDFSVWPSPYNFSTLHRISLSEDTSIVKFSWRFDQFLRCDCMRCNARYCQGFYICPSVCLSNACIVTKRKKLVTAFLYHMKNHLSQFYDKKNDWWGNPLFFRDRSQIMENALSRNVEKFFKNAQIWIQTRITSEIESVLPRPQIWLSIGDQWCDDRYFVLFTTSGSFRSQLYQTGRS